MPSIWGNLQGQIDLASEEFIAGLQASPSPEGYLTEIPRKQRRPIVKPLLDYPAEYADAAHTGMVLAYLTGDYTMKAIADAFGVHYTTVSRVVKTYELAQE